MARVPLFPPVFAPTVSHPMVDDFSMRAARMRARSQPPGIGSVFTLPPRNSPLWSGNSELGNEVPFAADANNRQMVIKLEEWGEPEVWTCMLGIVYTPTLLSDTSFFDLIAEVTAGVGGATQQFEVDWGEGTQFSCPMNALNVTAKFTVIGGALQVPADLRLRATLGRKPFTNTSAPTRSITSPLVPAGSFSSAILIPKFARRLTPMATFSPSDPYATTTSYFWQNNPTIPSTIGAFSGSEFLANFASNGIPVPTDARALIVVNNGLASTRVRLMFHLAL